MVSKTAIILLGLALAYGQCPTFSCSSALDSNVCANRVSNTAYQLNSNGCSSTYHCSAEDLMTWIGQFSNSATATSPLYTQNTYSCLPDDQVFATNPKVWIPATCYAHQANRGFKNGQAVVTCSQDIDCQLVDGSHTQCYCTFRTDGYGLCQPDISNDLVFADYWDDCGYDGLMGDEKAYNYWVAYRDLYVYQQSPLPCSDIFSELQELTTLWAVYDSAEVLALVLAFFI